jgi:creatinine amidohydrolase
MGTPEGVLDEDEERFGIHAGDMETSVMRALHPDHVQMEHARDFAAKVADMAYKNQHLGLSTAGKLGWQMQDMNAAGACGNASIATVEKGEAIIQNAAQQIVKLLQEVHQTPLSFLDTVADPEAYA